MIDLRPVIVLTVLAALLGATAGAGLSGSPVSGASRAAPTQGAILFSGGPAGSGAYAVDARGGSPKRLATVTLEYPRWAPDGRRLAFLHYTGSSDTAPDLYVTRAGGTRPRRIASTRSDDLAWSPDGSRIVLRDGRAADASSAGLAIVDVASGTLRALTSPNSAWDGSPVWSPDGRRIAFLRRVSDASQRDPCANGCGLVIDVNGSNQRKVAASAISMAWSPDGTHLAAAGAGPGGGVAIVRFDGGAVRSTRIVPRGIWAVAWSPDGRSIALTGWLAEGRSGTFLVRPDGTGFRRLSARGNLYTAKPSWSPDSRSIAVLDNPATSQSVNEIWAVDAAGRGAWRVTRAWRYGYEVWYPQWNPKGLTTAQLAGTAVSHAIPPQSGAAGNVLRTRGQVVQLVADGKRVALDIRDVRTPVVWGNTLELWAPADGGLARFGGSYGSGYPPFALPFNKLALGGARVALGAFGTGGGPVRYWINTATAATPRVVRASGPCPSSNGECFSTPLADAIGDGSLIVFDRWTCPGLTERRLCGSPKQDGELWRLDGTTAVRIATSTTALTPLAVDGGRILVDHEDGTFALLRADGSTIRAYTVDRSTVQAALLQGRDLALQTAAGIDVVDADTGALLRHWPLPAADARLADLQDGIAVLTAGADVHLLRLGDGATSIIHTDSTTPVLAQLEPPGLFYATTIDDAAFPGRVVYVPASRIPLAG